MSIACNEESSRALRTSWLQSTASRLAVPARLCKESSSNLKLSSERRHNIARASRSLTGGEGGVAGSVVFRLRSLIANPSKRQACSQAFAQVESDDLNSRLPIRMSLHS